MGLMGLLAGLPAGLILMILAVVMHRRSTTARGESGKWVRYLLLAVLLTVATVMVAVAVAFPPSPSGAPDADWYLAATAAAFLALASPGVGMLGSTLVFSALQNAPDRQARYAIVIGLLVVGIALTAYVASLATSSGGLNGANRSVYQVWFTQESYRIFYDIDPSGITVYDQVGEESGDGFEEGGRCWAITHLPFTRQDGDDYTVDADGSLVTVTLKRTGDRLTISTVGGSKRLFLRRGVSTRSFEPRCSSPTSSQSYLPPS